MLEHLLGTKDKVKVGPLDFQFRMWEMLLLKRTPSKNSFQKIHLLTHAHSHIPPLIQNLPNIHLIKLRSASYEAPQYSKILLLEESRPGNGDFFTLSVQSGGRQECSSAGRSAQFQLSSLIYPASSFVVSSSPFFQRRETCWLIWTPFLFSLWLLWLISWWVE